MKQSWLIRESSWKIWTGRIFDGEFILKLLEKAEFRRDMRDSVTALVDRIGLYFANQQGSATLKFLLHCSQKRFERHVEQGLIKQ